MLRRIFSYMKEYKKYAWLALICIGVEVVLEIMVPKLMADLIDIGVTNSDVPYIINKGIQMAVCAVAALILVWEVQDFLHLQVRDWVLI